jgi:hypothetical protein
MGNINASSNIRPGMPSTATATCQAKQPIGKFEFNSQHYGPAVATALSVADTVGDAASAVVSFSEKGLQELAKLPGEAYDLAKDAAHTVGDAVNAVEDGVEAAASEVASLAHRGLRQLEHAYDTVEHVASSVGQGMASGIKVANKASDAVSDVLVSAAKEVGSSAATVAGYTALGLGAAASRLTDLI